ncbi:hypothetical protein [Streptococcus halotolerans]|uniref:hypothetical protein n=1 Tax=Streptococcus halotolerans TaxID=1814128 RepID=UPI000A53BF21|nr:hypothetical protein [Streptococcus halotolerans]
MTKEFTSSQLKLIVHRDWITAIFWPLNCQIKLDRLPYSEKQNKVFDGLEIL